MKWQSFRSTSSSLKLPPAFRCYNLPISDQQRTSETRATCMLVSYLWFLDIPRRGLRLRANPWMKRNIIKRDTYVYSHPKYRNHQLSLKLPKRVSFTEKKNCKSGYYWSQILTSDTTYRTTSSLCQQITWTQGSPFFRLVCLYLFRSLACRYALRNQSVLQISPTGNNNSVRLSVWHFLSHKYKSATIWSLWGFI